MLTLFSVVDTRSIENKLLLYALKLQFMTMLKEHRVLTNKVVCK